MLSASAIRRFAIRASGCVLVLKTGVDDGSMISTPRSSRSCAFCDAPPSHIPPVNRRRARQESRQTTTSSFSTAPADTPQKLSMEVVNKAVEEVKQATQAVGPFDQNEALGIMALLAKEVVREAAGKDKEDAADERLSPTLTSPPVSSSRTKQLAEYFLEYATLCEATYDVPDDKDWQQPFKELGDYGCWKLLASHPGGVCIPRYVVIRCDGGVGTKGKRRTRRIIVAVRGTAEASDAAINVAMTPGIYKHQGVEHQCHRGIIEAATFLIRMIRPVIWRAIDEIKAEGIDPGHEVEVIITGHSLGAATSAIAALELQGEFGPRVPVRSIGFATPASLSESLAIATTTKRIVKTMVMGDDIIPRCSTRNLQELRIKAAEIVVDQELNVIAEMIKEEMNRYSDDYYKQMMIMLKPPSVEKYLPQGLGETLATLQDVGGLKGMIDSILPQQFNAWKEKGAKAVVEEAMAEYQAVLDAEIKHVQDQMERIRWDALQQFMPVKASDGDEKGKIEVEGGVKDGVEEGLEGDEDEEEKEEEEELLKESAKQAKPLDMEAIQASLTKLIEEKSTLAKNVKHEAEKRVRDVISSSSERLEQVKEKANDTVKWVTSSIQGLRSQTSAPSSSAAPEAESGDMQKGDRQSEVEEATDESPSVREEEEEKKAKSEKEKTIASTPEGIPLYPPGEVIWLRPKPSQRAITKSGNKTNSRAEEILKQQRMGGGFELRRVKDPHFFDGIIISPSMFTHHLLTQYIVGLKALKEEKGNDSKK